MDAAGSTEHPTHAERRGVDRTLLVVLVTIAALVVVALVVVLSRGSAAPLDASRPEGVVQRYAQALADGDNATALTHLADGAAEPCYGSYDTTVNSRLSFIETVVTGDSATVTVTVTTTYGSGLFGSSQSTSEERFLLTDDGGEWKITQAPYQYMVCDPELEIE